MSTSLTVTSTEQLTPRLTRVWFHSDDLSAFEGSDSTDRYVKLVFPRPGVEYPEPLDMRALRATMAPEDLPVVRTYTALFPDVAAGTLAIDFVVHGDEGVAGPWAAAAQPGNTLLANGPGGGYRPDPSADWHLLAGDESAIPAITAALEVLGPEAVARVVLLVDGPDHQLAVRLPAGAELTWVHRQTGGDLVEAVRALDWPTGRVHAFVHGEGRGGDARDPSPPPARARSHPRPGVGLGLLAAGPHRGRLPRLEVRARRHRVAELSGTGRG